MRREMEEDPGPAWPRVLTFLVDGKGLEWHHIDPGMMADWRDKNKIALMIVTQCFRADVRCCVFLSDVFGVASKDPMLHEKLRKLYGPYFSDWPAEFVHEALMLTVNARGTEGAYLQAPYTRGLGDRRQFGELERQPAAEGRFFYDLRTVTEYGAVLEVLMRGRDGRPKAAS